MAGTQTTSGPVAAPVHGPDNPPAGFKANPHAKYKLLHGRHQHDDGTEYFAGVPGHDIVPQSFKHPMGLDRWPEKFLKLHDDAYSRAARAPETIEELRARLVAMEAEEAAKNSGKDPGVQDMINALNDMTTDELRKHASQMDPPLDLSNVKKKEEILKAIKQAEGLPLD